VVEIAGVLEEQDWTEESKDYKNSVSGLIVADNGRELLILGKSSVAKDEKELKKYGVLSLLDSIEFINEDYFKNGNLYLCTNDITVFVDKEVLAKNWSIKKDPSI